MPLYFFDTNDGERRVRDDMGITMAGIADVEREAMALLRDLAHFDVTVRRREMAVTVRDHRDRMVYRGEMIIVGERIEDHPPMETSAPPGGGGQDRSSLR